VLESAHGQHAPEKHGPHPRQPAALEPDQQRLQCEHEPQIGATPRLWDMYSIPTRTWTPWATSPASASSSSAAAPASGPGRAAEGAKVVRLDLSEAQLAAAARAMGAAHYPLVQGAAEQLPCAGPLRPGALRLRRLSRAPPHLAVPQAARVSGRGERLVFNVASQPTHPTAHTAGLRNCCG
jgi:hypothetical protein